MLDKSPCRTNAVNNVPTANLERRKKNDCFFLNYCEPLWICGRFIIVYRLNSHFLKISSEQPMILTQAFDFPHLLQLNACKKKKDD